jgi:ribose transport system permease protein
MTPSSPSIEGQRDETLAAEPPITNGRASWRTGLSRATNARDYGIVIVLVVLFLALTFSTDVFLTKTNLLAILDQNAPIGIVAVGTTLVFISGGFDLSIGAVYALGGVISALLVPEVGFVLAILGGASVGIGVGLLNGSLVTAARINPFVTTLATSIIVGGVATIIHGGAPIFVTDPNYARFGNDEILGLKITIIVWVVFCLVCGFLLQRTLLGRYVYALGGSEEASRLSGVRVARVRLACYALSGFAAALAGVMVASRASSGQGNAGGFGLAVTAVAAVVVGGTSILGGQGAIWRTVTGVLILALIGNGFDLLGVNADYQALFQGGLILVAVGIDTWARRRS